MMPVTTKRQKTGKTIFQGGGGNFPRERFSGGKFKEGNFPGRGAISPGGLPGTFFRTPLSSSIFHQQLIKSNFCKFFSNS